MKLHLFHFTPHGLVRAYSHLIAGKRLCRVAGVKLMQYVPESVNSMTAAWNFWLTMKGGNLIKPGTIIDVGANCSQMTKLLLLSTPDARVISFEPNPKLRPMGEKYEIALSDSDGMAEFYMPHGDDAWGTIEQDNENISAATRHFTVRQASMKSLIQAKAIPWSELPRPILVKIDTEGSEKRVIEGFGAYLQDIAYMIVEVENVETRGGNYSMVDLCCLMASYGFRKSKLLYACYDGPDAPAYSDVMFWKNDQSVTG